MAHLTRRTFLAGSAGLALSGSVLAACGDREKGSVVIVGAGLAGLVAAYDLEALGWDVTVVEARDRVGGRVWTLRSPFEGGQYAEAGGEFIDANHTTMRELAAELDLDLVDLRNAEEEGDGKEGVLYFDGERVSEEEVDAELQPELERWDEAVGELGSEPELDRSSVADLLDEVDLDPAARTAVEHNQIRGEFTVEPDELSALFYSLSAPGGDELEENDVERFQVEGGNDQIPRGLTERLGDRVVLDAPATRVEQRRDGVRVTAGGERFDADYAVIASPLPPLAEVDFAPALPAALVSAIAELPYGSAAKTMLQYDQRFWSDAGLTGDTSTDLGISNTWDPTIAQDGERGILMCFTAADAGVRFGRLAEGERYTRAEEDIAEIYPEATERVAATGVVWQRERYTGGSYAAARPGQVTAFGDALRKPAGRLYFAGEHTDDFFGYMEGAARSGRRVARAIDARGTG